MNEQKCNFALIISDTDIFITILKTGKTFYTNYNSGLYELLKSGIFVGATTNGAEYGNYVKFAYDYNKHKPIYAYFHHIVFCYHYRGLTKDNYKDVLNAFRDELKESLLAVDHLQDGNYNNRIWNLSLMPRSNNLQKRSVEKRFKDIFNVMSAYDGKRYRVQFTYLNKGIRTMKYYCDTPIELCFLLKYLHTNKWELRRKKIGKNSTDNMFFVVGKLFPHIVENESIQDMQKLLVELPIEEFTRYEN